MGRHLGDTQTGGERGGDHLHLDRGVPRLELQGAEKVGADGAEAVLGVRKTRAEAPVEHESDERRAGEAEELVAAAMEFVGAAEEARTGDVLGDAGLDGGDEHGDVDGIVGAVGVDEDADGRGDLSDGETEGGAFAASLVADNACASGESHGSGAVGGAALDDDDVGDEFQALLDDEADGELLVAGGNDDGDIRVRLVLRAHQVIRGGAALPQQALGAADDEQAFAFTETDNVTSVVHGKVMRG